MEAQRVSLRVATPGDAVALSVFASRVFSESFSEYNTAEDMAAYSRSTFSTEHQAREIADPDSVVLLAESPAGAIAGYAHLMRSEPPAELDRADAADADDVLEVRRFYVAKEWQGSGVAARLMRETMRHASTRGARRLWLGVWERNPRAIAFYRKVGFHQIGSHVFVLGSDHQTDLLMATSLLPVTLQDEAGPEVR